MLCCVALRWVGLGLGWVALGCVVLRCVVLYCVVLCFLCCIVLYCTVWCCIVLYCIALYNIAKAVPNQFFVGIREALNVALDHFQNVAFKIA